jgi:hypothetical protein
MNEEHWQEQGLKTLIQNLGGFMKKIIIGVVSLVALSAQAAPELSSFYCKHRVNRALESRARYDLRIIETAKLPPGNNDAKRSVVIEKLRVIGTSAKVIHSFNGIATYNDVEYEIKAPQDDFNFSLYLDEPGPALVISHDSSGAEVESLYDCDLEN